MNYILHLLVLTELYLMLGLSLNLMVGYAGLVTMAHAAFYGVGAYVAALLMIKFGLSFLPAVAAAVAAAVALSMVVSLASLRFRGDYFIVATLAFQILTFTVLYNWESVTRGPFGVTNIPAPVIAGLRVEGLVAFALVGLCFTLLIGWLLRRILHGPFGRTIQAIRDDEVAAASLGKDVVSFKVRTVATACGCAAVAGALYASYVSYIDPTSFNIDESILILSMVIVGGSGNLRGPLVGAALLVLLPELLRFCSLSGSAAAFGRMIIYGLMLILFMRFRPRGLAGKYQFE